MNLASLVAKVEQVPRSYRQTVRAQSVEETRRHIISAARTCVLRLGYRRMTIEAVAEEAGVSRGSVFRHFQSKAELLRAVEADAALRGGAAALVEEVSHLDPLEGLRRATREGSRVWAREARVFREFYGEAPFDAVLRPLVLDKEAQRHEVVANLVRRLSLAGELQTATTPDAVADALWVLTGFATFDALTSVRGLSPDETSTLIEQVFSAAFIASEEGSDRERT